MWAVSWGCGRRMKQMWQNVNLWGIWVGTVRKLFTLFCNLFVSQNKFLFYVKIKSEKFKTPLAAPGWW